MAKNEGQSYSANSDKINCMAMDQCSCEIVASLLFHYPLNN